MYSFFQLRALFNRGEERKETYFDFGAEPVGMIAADDRIIDLEIGSR